MSHTVTITKLPDEESGEHGPSCSVYVECKRKACQAMNPDCEPGDERFRHGKEHFYRDGDWLVESDLCSLRYVFEYTTAAETFDGVAVGTYPVLIQWEDTWWLEVLHHPVGVSS
jgi:hypothetical protein